MALALSLLCAITARPSFAQTTQEYRLLVDSLQAEWEQALAAHSAFVEAERARPMDTIRVGTLNVITVPDYAEVAFDGARLAWDSIRVVGSDTLLLLGKALYLPTPGWAGYRQHMNLAGTVATRMIGARSDAKDVSVAILASIGGLLFGDTHEEIRLWVGSGVGLRHAGQTDLNWTYVNLVTAPSQSVRECFRGDLVECRNALGLEELEDPASVWYNAEERRYVVSRRRPGRIPGYADIWFRCVEGGDDAACLQYLRTAYEGVVPIPLTYHARSTLLGVAVQMGGEGAFTRLIGAEVSDRSAWLSTVAAAPTDSVLAEWRRAVISARPASATLSGAKGWVALVWIALFAAAAMRSTRWRLG